MQKFCRINRALIIGCARLLFALVVLTQLASAAYATSVTLAWDPVSSSNLAGYNIYRSQQSGVFTAPPLNGSTPIKVASFGDSAVQSGTTYYYVVRAVETTGLESASSNEIQASVTPVVTTLLPSPTGLASQCSSDVKNFTVRWDPVTGAENYYLRIDNVSNNANGLQYIASEVDYYLDKYASTSFTGSVVAGQNYTWWVHAANTASGIGPASTGTFTCTDTTAPTVSMTAPAGGATVSGSVTVSASASDNIGVVGVQFKLNGANLGAEVMSAPYSKSWNTTTVSAGSYTLSAVARDVAGNQTTSAGVVVTVGGALTAPGGLAAQCSSDVKNFTVRWDPVTGAENYYLRVDNVSNNANGLQYIASEVDYYLDKYATTSFTGSVVAGQNYTWWVHAANTASGIGPASSGTFTCTDTTAPTVSMTGPAGGATVSGTVTVTASASDNAGVAGVQLKLNGANLGAEMTSAPYSTSWNTTTVSNGSYTLSAVARDLAGNQTTSAGVLVTVSNNPLTAPTGLASQCNNNGTFTVYWDALTGAENYYLRVDDLANNANGLQFIASEVDYYLDNYTQTSFTGSVVSGHAYSWWVYGSNSASGIGPSSLGKFTCADTTPPTVTIDKPATGSGSTVTISATASDNVGVVGVQFKVKGVNLGLEDTTAPYSTTWNTSKLANGTYTLQAVARDAAGNQTVSPTVTVTIKKGVINGVRIVAAGDAWSGESETLSVGYAHLEQEAGTVSAIISMKNGDIVVSETSVPASIPVREGRVYVDVNGPVNTGMAIANDDTEDALISFYFTDGTGADFGRGSFTLGAKQQVTAFVNQAPFNLPVAMQGSLTFDSSVPVGVAALRGFTNERGEFLMTTLPVGSVGAAPAGQPIMFPHFADGQGWTTQVVLTNPTDLPLTGTVRFFDSGSPAAGASVLAMTVNGVTNTAFSYTIAPRSVVRMVTANSSTDVKVGSVLVTPADHGAAPQGISIFSFSSQGITVSEAGVPAQSTGTAFRTYIAQLGTLRSGLALANPSTSPAHVRLGLTTLDGQPTGLTASVDIPAGGHVAQFMDELFPSALNGFEGVLELVSTQPIAAVGLRMRNNERGELLITAMPVTDEASTSYSSDLVFPLVVRGGGYTTEFVGISR